ncbi:DUF3024 domain-containing protein [Marinomonas agarivorans]|nr:DUF3024 domain-containing protein [Marinomonas agarivorans]
MAISEFEIKRCERKLEEFMAAERPPMHIRKELDFGYSIENQSIELFEIRPEWQNPENVIHIPVAKATYVKSKKVWKIYWQRQDLKWHRYAPCPEVKYFEDFLAIVREDANACFFS